MHPMRGELLGHHELMLNLSYVEELLPPVKWHSGENKAHPSPLVFGQSYYRFMLINFPQIMRQGHSQDSSNQDIHERASLANVK